MAEEEDEWDWEDDPTKAEAEESDDEALDEEMEQKVQMAMQRLKNFQYDLADDVVMARINKELKSIPFPKFIQYYRKKSDETDLASLTINNELNRMDYEVVYQGGKTTDKEEIREIFSQTRRKEIWCLANQSIYGDILTTLQMYFLSSELCITISNSDSNFVIDVDSDCLHSESTFAIGCNKMVELASIKSSITVSLKDEAIKQVLYSPELMMVFDQNLREAAIAVVEIEGTYQSYQMREEGGSSHGGGGGRDSLRDRIENIDIEAVREKLLETSHVVIGHVGGFLNKLPVVGNIIDNLTEDKDNNDGIIDFTDTTGLGNNDSESYYSDSADDEPGPVNVKAITGTLFSWGSTIASGIGNIVERVAEDSNKQPTLYRRESGGSKNSAAQGKDRARTSNSSSRSRPTYDDLPPTAADSAPLSFKQGVEKKAAPPSGDAGTTNDLLDFSGDSNTPTQGAASGTDAETAGTGGGDLLDLLSATSIDPGAAASADNNKNSSGEAGAPEVLLRKKKGNR